MPTLPLTNVRGQSRAVCASWLSSHSFEVEAAGNGLKCLAKLRRVSELLILAPELPWVGGDGLLAILLEDSRYPSTRFSLTAVAPGHVLDPFAWHCSLCAAGLTLSELDGQGTSLEGFKFE